MSNLRSNGFTTWTPECEPETAALLESLTRFLEYRGSQLEEFGLADTEQSKAVYTVFNAFKSTLASCQESLETSPVDWRKKDLLAQYAEKPVREFIQLDGFVNMIEDSVTHPDKDGDALCAVFTRELRASDEMLPVRIQIIKGTTPEVALRLLKKMQDWIERCPELLTESHYIPRLSSEEEISL